MDRNANALSWFEIPAVEIERAKTFYEGIFDMKMAPMEGMMGMKMVYFLLNQDSGKVGGALVESDHHNPSDEGLVIYLKANPDIQSVIGRIDAFGGEVLVPRTQISAEIGYLAFFKDTEGNRVALHAYN